jgi:hypothetical protein
MYIKANELRVGNWVRYSDRERTCSIVAVTAIYTSGIGNILIWGDDVPLDVKHDNCYPIPLTPEILEKCGFSFSFTTDDAKFLPIDELFINHNNDNFPILNNKEDAIYASSYGYNEGIGIKYLHQLQNRFFSLTGEELIYNPK